MSKFVWNMSGFHKSWRKAKEDAVKEAKKIDKSTASKVEKWMKKEFDRGLGDRFDDAHKAFESLAKAWTLAKDKLGQPAVRDKLTEIINATIIKLNPAELVLDSYRQSVGSRFAKEEIPASVLSILSDSIKSLQQEMDKTTKQIAEWKHEFDEFIEKLSPVYGDMDIQDLVARFSPELLIK